MEPKTGSFTTFRTPIRNSENYDRPAIQYTVAVLQERCRNGVLFGEHPPFNSGVKNLPTNQIFVRLYTSAKKNGVLILLGVPGYPTRYRKYLNHFLGIDAAEPFFRFSHNGLIGPDTTRVSRAVLGYRRVVLGGRMAPMSMRSCSATLQEEAAERKTT